MFPWAPVTLALAGALLLVREGLICVVIAPIMLFMSSIGGVCAGIARDLLMPGARNSVLLCSPVLPILVAPVEQLHSPQRQIREVNTAIRINAPARAIWEQINGWTYGIGFPRPVGATLDRERIGGIH